MVILFSAVEERRRDRNATMHQKASARRGVYFECHYAGGWARGAGVGQDHVQQLLLTLHSFHYSVCIEKRNT